MIRFVLRFIGFWFLAAAFVALVYDGARAIAGSQVTFTKLGDTWNAIHSTSLQLLQPAIERHVAVWLWDPILLNILTSPTWAVFGVLGVIFILLGRRKKPLIGYARS